MAWGFCSIYSLYDGDVHLQALIDLLREGEFSITRPGTQKVYMWDDELPFDSMLPRDTKVFTDQLDERKETSFQIWINNSDDFFCGFRWLTPSIFCENYTLKGIDQPSLTYLVDLLKRRFLASAEDNKAIFFVADAIGITEEYDWDDFVLRQQYREPDSFNYSDLPDIIGLRQEYRQCFTEHRSCISAEIAGEYALLTFSDVRDAPGVASIDDVKL